MEKIKKIISSHNNDEQPKYTDPNVGSPVGTSANPTSASAAADSTTTATTAPAIRPQYLEAAADDNVSTLGIRSGVPGGDASAPSHLESSTAGGASTTERSFPLANTTGQSSLARDPALTGASGTAGLEPGTIGLRSDPSTINTGLLSHEHAGRGHQFDPSAVPAAPVEGYLHQFDGPHGTDIANRLDPHVGNTASSSLDAGRVSTGSVAAVESQSRDTHEPSAAEIAGYDDQKFDPALAHRHKEGAHGGLVAGSAAGATASGIGAYELAEDRQGGPDSTGPASKTVGPHSSNLANILDPRVLPQPENQDGRTNASESRSGYGGAVAGGAGGAAIDPKAEEKLDQERAKEAEKAHERAQKDNHNKLHKDPPPKIQRELEAKSREY